MWRPHITFGLLPRATVDPVCSPLRPTAQHTHTLAFNCNRRPTPLPCYPPPPPHTHTPHTTQGIVDGIAQTHEIPTAEAALDIAQYLIDVIFAVWIMKALRRTIAHLRARQQSFKLTLYLRYRNCLIVAVVACGCYAAAIMLHAYGGESNMSWATTWGYKRGWDAIFALVLLVIMWLWLPTQNSGRYAYMEQVTASTSVPTAADDVESDDEVAVAVESAVEMGPVSDD